MRVLKPVHWTIVMIFSSFPSDYQAALRDAAFFILPDAGYLRFAGADRVDFLNRQTTNDVRLLTPDRSITTVLTTATARMSDVLTLVDQGDALGAMTLAGHAAATARHFQGKIFFMDKVAVEDVSDEVVQIDLDGPRAGSLLRNLNVVAPPGQDAVTTTGFAGSEIRVTARKGLVGPGFRLLAPAIVAEIVQQALAAAGFTKLMPETHDILRIEAGLPASNAELSEDYNPLEAGLEAAISESKGCYTGQEIIARQITYDKVTKRLVGLRLEALVEPGSTVGIEGKKAGTVTSVADSPRFGPIALAYLKRPHHLPGTRVLLQSPAAASVPATVATLPFSL